MIKDDLLPDVDNYILAPGHIEAELEAIFGEIFTTDEPSYS